MQFCGKKDIGHFRVIRIVGERKKPWTHRVSNYEYDHQESWAFMDKQWDLLIVA